MIKLQTKKWSIVYYTNSNPVRKYSIHLHAISDDTGTFPAFPVTVVESGKPGSEVYACSFMGLEKQHFLSLNDMALHFQSAIEWFESLEDFS